MIQQINTGVVSEDVEEQVLLIGGEPASLILELISEVTKSRQLLIECRGFSTYRCKSRRETPFTLAITGVGPSATEIAVIEYSNCGAKVFIRAGTSGALSDTIAVGSVVLTTRALRFDGVSDLYIGKRLRAIANREIVQALEHSAQQLGIDYSIGTTLSTSGFYAMGGMAKAGGIAFGGGVLDGIFEPQGLKELRNLKRSTQVLNVEMETATLLTLSRIYNLKSGSVCGISNRIPWEIGQQIHNTEMALHNAILVAVEALDYLYGKQC
jgi:uridine phosphorylase